MAVSISSGVAQITSAFPALYDYRVEIAVGLVLFMMVVNLRGVRESGAAFAIPSYFFLVMMSLTVLIGLIRYVAGHAGAVVVDPPPMETVQTMQAVSLFLILHAFASGTTALTGVEAISNGITAFQGAAQPQRRHHADLDVEHPGRAVPGHHLPVRPDRRSPIGRRDGHLATGAHRVRRPQR